MVTSEDDRWLIGIAWRLDRLRWVPGSVLGEIVTSDGACMSLFTEDSTPPWDGAYLTDRALAARLCAGCPVQDECLEWELRLAGDEPIGVWGALAEDDRHALHPYWLQRGERADGGEPS